MVILTNLRSFCFPAVQTRKILGDNNCHVIGQNFENSWKKVSMYGYMCPEKQCNAMVKIALKAFVTIYANQVWLYTSSV